MSAIYNLEPQPTASCILHTTSGDISLELFAQQTPLTARNFLQLCLDGYYDNTIFHRLIPGFILQGGDPTGTGNGGESIYDGGAFGESREAKPPGVWPMEEREGRNAGPMGVGFKDEFHSRLKFNRRGLLGMANEGPNTNGSQFFLTLAATPELQGKNTIFGRVAGETIYNVAKMGEAEVDPNTDRPMYPTKITSTEVLVNPFKDMVPRKRTAAPVQSSKPVEKKKKRKGGKQLLSFGDEEAEDEAPLPLKKAKFDSRIVADVGDEQVPAEKKEKAERKVEKKTEKPIKKRATPTPSPSPEPVPKATKQAPPPREPSRSPSSSPEPMQKVNTLLEQTNAQIAELKASMRRNVQTAPVTEKKKSALEQMIPATSIKGRKRNGQTSTATDQQALDILKAFQSRLEKAESADKSTLGKHKESHDHRHEVKNTSKGPDDDDDEAALCDLHFIANCQSCQKWDGEKQDEEDDDDDRSWMSHALSFQADKLGKDLNYRKKAEEELVVIDPREKARTLKEERKAEREARAGNSGRAWDQARNEKLARASAFAGRGAK